jgi:hypothetical protein
MSEENPVVEVAGSDNAESESGEVSPSKIPRAVLDPEAKSESEDDDYDPESEEDESNVSEEESSESSGSRSHSPVRSSK